MRSVRSSFVNTVTGLAVVLAIASFLAMLALMLLEYLGIVENPYVGMLTYMILPTLLVVALLLVPLGALLRRRQLRQHPDEAQALPFPVLDLNDPRQRKGAAFFGVSTVGILIALSVSTFGAVEFMDSTAFCGELCHRVMRPELEAYQSSPHARVNCVNCHIGPGADWLVKSKISGTRQVIAYLGSTFPRPIQTPIEDLRPARETCERCHWPEKFYEDRVMTLTRFEADAENTRRDISMVVKTGGGIARTGLAKGIHWHVQAEVWYVASDDRRQTIPWVQVRNTNGTTTEYISSDSSLSPEQLAGMEKRRMDCIDCHNRATHIFRSLEDALDDAIAHGQIDPSLPFVKKRALETLEAVRDEEMAKGPASAGFLSTTAYASANDVPQRLADVLVAKYREADPQLSEERKVDIRHTAEQLWGIFRESVFPEMKTDYRAFPDNVQHKDSPGCFRCHDGKHESKSGEAVRLECNLCHSIPQTVGPNASIAQTLMPEPSSHLSPQWTLNHGKEDRLTCQACHQPTSLSSCANEVCHGRTWLGQSFNHPVELKGKHASADCSACHNRPEPLTSECKTCHQPPANHKTNNFPEDCSGCHEAGGRFKRG